MMLRLWKEGGVGLAMILLSDRAASRRGRFVFVEEVSG